MRPLRLIMLAVVLVSAAGCTESRIVAGMCLAQKDCPSGLLCIDKTCVAGDSDGGADASQADRNGDRGSTTETDGPITDRSASDVMGLSPDAVGSCGTAADCASANPAKPVCGPGGACVECGVATDCKDASKPFCVANACVGCAAAGPQACATASPGKPICGPAGACVECGLATDCKDASKPFCVANVCTSCSAAGAQACATAAPAKPACGPGGACVECAGNTDCKDASKPFCAANSSCVSCNAPGALECSKLNAAKPFCSAGGACLECGSDAQCTADPNRPFCVANACVGCAKATVPTACAGKDMAKPACGPAGACVECVASADCAQDVGRPICEANKCRKCSADSECAAKGGGPGVCMTHQDGRCAAEGETVYVQQTSGCGGVAATSAMPVCSLQDAGGLLSARRLVVVRGAVNGGAFAFSGSQVTIVGQMDGAIAAAASPGLRVSSGDLYARGLVVNGGTGVNGTGIVADSGATLRLDGVKVTNNAGGGILLDGARFDIRNTTVAGNGHGKLGLASWGGIAINNPPASGPAKFERVTVKDSKQVGIVCSAAVQGVAVSASGNLGTEVDSTCGFTSCGAPGPTCGAP